MSAPPDRRFFAANARVAFSRLEGQVDAPRFTGGHQMRCAVPVADLCSAPGGARDKQLLRGQAFDVLEVHDGWAFGFCTGDGYVGYVDAGLLEQTYSPTHRVRVRATHVYPEPDLKAREMESLSFHSDLRASRQVGEFAEISGGGYVPRVHLAKLGAIAEDPVAVARMFLGAPYLWGGNSAFGIDCSGLVQLAFNAVGRAVPRDSDLQARSVGRELDSRGQLRRGDLVFWVGHVGIMLDEQTLLHANAHHMSVVTEPLGEAVKRIADHGGGKPTMFRRA